MDLETRLMNLHDSLGEMSGAASWQTAQIFNVLLDETKKQYPDDPVVATIEPARQSSTAGVSTSPATTLRAATSQLLSAVRGT